MRYGQKLLKYFGYIYLILKNRTQEKIYHIPLFQLVDIFAICKDMMLNVAANIF